MKIWDFIHDLKFKHRIYTNKQMKFISHVAIYTNDLKVYKIIVFADLNKQSRHKAGVDDIKIYYKSDVSFDFPTLTKELEGSENGNKIFIYYPKTEVLNCYEGEAQRVQSTLNPKGESAI